MTVHSIVRSAAPGALILALVTGCGGTTTASDPTGEPTTTPASASPSASPSSTPDDGRPTEIPAADGPVATRTIVTVIDTGDGPPELCLGAVAESDPPQCDGPQLRGWDWSDHDGLYEQTGDVRWGQFVVTGTFDGSAMTVIKAMSAALNDPAAPSDGPQVPDTREGKPGSGLGTVASDLKDRPLPGQLSVVTTEVSVVVDVVHDDGSLQEWADATYGAGMVEVISALVPVRR